MGPQSHRASVLHGEETPEHTLSLHAHGEAAVLGHTHTPQVAGRLPWKCLPALRAMVAGQLLPGPATPHEAGFPQPPVLVWTRVGAGGPWRDARGRASLSPAHLLTGSPAPAIWSERDPAEPCPHPSQLPSLPLSPEASWGPEMPTNPETGELNTRDSFRPC